MAALIASRDQQAGWFVLGIGILALVFEMPVNVRKPVVRIGVGVVVALLMAVGLAYASGLPYNYCAVCEATKPAWYCWLAGC